MRLACTHTGDKNWGYIRFDDPERLLETYAKFAEKLIVLQTKVVSAAVYTQTTDVECEINGLMTYDREVVKVDEERFRAINENVIRACNSCAFNPLHEADWTRFEMAAPAIFLTSRRYRFRDLQGCYLKYFLKNPQITEA